MVHVLQRLCLQGIDLKMRQFEKFENERIRKYAVMPKNQ
jgi:hypothetical protein